MKLKPLGEKIGKLVDQFLDNEEYYERFESIARANGVVSKDPTMVKVSMFSDQDGELIFISKELEELFFEWQVFESIRDQEPYAELLIKFPERKSKVIEVAKNLLGGIDVTNEAMNDLFEGLYD